MTGNDYAEKLLRQARALLMASSAKSTEKARIDAILRDVFIGIREREWEGFPDYSSSLPSF